MSQDRLKGSRPRCWRCHGSAVVLATVMMAHSAMAQQETEQTVVENVRSAHVPASIVMETKHNNPPRYPSQAFRDEKEGEAILMVQVAADGQWLGATVLQSTGWPELDEAAQAATRKWQYLPASEDGVPVPGKIRVPVSFKLW
ncbi:MULTISPECIES: energy transducer TonB [Stenotrophomonas]|uniref:Energy transducer TonB n=1 Tax=Stenotrophomonas maltophilia TaxID=40324 RepID=A0A3S0HA20_STEMA|nr:energy transducer TonB [Stenotrophomonas maltophilia]RTQ85992.1 energy transducer TonB [Stenotrophomonas maltophilia]